MNEKIRLAVAADAGPLFSLLLEMHKEVGMAPLNEQKVRARIDTLIKTGLVLVAERNGDIVGSIGASFQRYWYSDAMYLGDSWTYVHPAHRKSRIAVSLLSALRMSGKVLKVPVMVGVWTTKDVEAKNRLFRRYFKPVGAFFMGS